MDGTPAPGLIRRLWEWLDTRAALRTVQLGVLFAVVSVAVLYVQDRKHADCLRRYNEATSLVSKARAEASDRRAEALAQAIKASVDQGGAAYAAAARRYLDQYEAEKRTREEHPLVPPPSDYCS